MTSKQQIAERREFEMTDESKTAVESSLESDIFSSGTDLSTGAVGEFPPVSHHQSPSNYEASARGDFDTQNNALPVLSMKEITSEAVSNPTRESIGAKNIAIYTGVENGTSFLSMAHDGKPFDDITDMINSCIYKTNVSQKKYAPDDTSMYNSGIKDITDRTTLTKHFSLHDEVLTIMELDIKLRTKKNKYLPRGGTRCYKIKYPTNKDTIKDSDLFKLVEEYEEFRNKPYCKNIKVLHKYIFNLSKVEGNSDDDSEVARFLEYKFSNDLEEYNMPNLYHNEKKLEYKSIKTPYSVEDTVGLREYKGIFYLNFNTGDSSYPTQTKGANPIGDILVNVSDPTMWYPTLGTRVTNRRPEVQTLIKNIMKPENLISEFKLKSYSSKYGTPQRDKIEEKLSFVGNKNNTSVSIGFDNIYNFNGEAWKSGNSDKQIQQMTEVLVRYNGDHEERTIKLYRDFLKILCNSNKNEPTNNSTIRRTIQTIRDKHFKQSVKDYPLCHHRFKKCDKCDEDKVKEEFNPDQWDSMNNNICSKCIKTQQAAKKAATEKAAAEKAAAEKAAKKATENDAAQENDAAEENDAVQENDAAPQRAQAPPTNNEFNDNSSATNGERKENDLPPPSPPPPVLESSPPVKEDESNENDLPQESSPPQPPRQTSYSELLKDMMERYIPDEEKPELKRICENLTPEQIKKILVIMSS